MHAAIYVFSYAGLNASGNRKSLSPLRMVNRLNVRVFPVPRLGRNNSNMSEITDIGNCAQREFISRAAAARALRMSPISLDRIIQAHKIQTFQIPGYSRCWIDRAAVEKLVADAAGQTGGSLAITG